jgi:carbamoyl-phosphate synthase large subunit
MGWKEYELELLRDNCGNVIIICSIENSIRWEFTQVIRSLLLRDDITRHGLSTHARSRDQDDEWNRKFAGGCNVQFSLNPTTMKESLVSRSTLVFRGHQALASKATDTLSQRLRQARNRYTPR